MLINQCILQTLINRDLNVEAQRIGFYVNTTSCILAKARCDPYNPITGQLQQPLNVPAGTTGRTGANSLQMTLTGDIRIVSFPRKVAVGDAFCSSRTLLDQSTFESDSSVRMGAEENLSRIVRHCESTGNIIRVQRDLYHEIKKNGNERSLRTVLSIFAHYCGTIRQRKARTYAQNMLPCIYSIFKRREPALLECLCSFTEVFCQHLEGYLTDGEVLKMTELFLEDIGSDCATKRRCAAKNTHTFIQGSRNPDFYANNAFNRCIEQLLKCGQPQQQSNTVLGVMGCFRAILPIVLRNCSVEKAIETYDLCLHFLREGTHTIINATLEVLLVILGNVQPAVRKVLVSEQCDHRRMLLKRKTLKNSIFKINPNDSLLSSRKSSTDARSDQLLRPGSLPLTSTPTKFSLPVDDRSLASASDIELDSLKSMDLDTESRTAAPALQLECSGTLDTTTGVKSSAVPPAPDTLSLKSQKSTDSIGSFINTLLTSSQAAESVTKFFRKSIDKPLPDDGEEDRLSMESMASSYMSSNAETVRAELDVTLEIDLDTEPATVVPTASVPTPTPSRDTLEVPLSTSMVIEDGVENVKELFIGTVHDQNLLDFTARLICSRFLLAGTRHVLIPDSIVRVSVKSLSMQIMAACVRMKPELLCLPLERDTFREEFAVVEILNLEDAINEFSQEASSCDDQPDGTSTVTPLQEKADSELLEMKEDHFGECTSATYFEYFSPMSLSLDQGLKSKLKSIEENFSIGNNEKLSRDLDAILSQSEPGPGSTSLTGASGTIRRRELLVVPRVITTIKNEHRTGPMAGSVETQEDKSSITAMAVSNQKEPEDEEQQQLLADVLLFYDSPDPTLRGTVQLIVAYGQQGDQIREKVLDLLLISLGDSDQRVRNHAAERLLRFVQTNKWDDGIRQKQTQSTRSVVGDFVDEFVLAILSSFPANAATDSEALNKFIIHLLKLLNIYHHVYTNATPLVINRAQKADIFMNTKELQQINCFGYFGNDHAYMKLYQQVHCSIESYRISINAESGQKLFDCLRASMEALWTLLEMKSLSAMTNGLKFVEEVLRYMQTFLTLEPDHCVRCTRYLLRFIFHVNYINRTAEVSFFRKASTSEDPIAVVASEEFFGRYYDFCKAKSKPLTPEIGAFVKLFEPLVITCLKIFTKMRSAVQASILHLLCQLLDFNINYQLLDANNVFVESIFKHIESIERGTIDDSEELMRQVVRFLFQLSGLIREKPLVTIPKIINMCDNLLANNVIRRTAIASVQALSHEIFLLRLSRSSMAPKVLEAAECNTQKEVVLNMLMKFPDELDAYRIIPMIMYSERLHDSDGTHAASCESDVLTALLQVLGDGKLMIKRDPDYCIILRLFECLSLNQLLESKVVLRLVDIFFTTITNDSWKTLQKITYGELIVRQIFQQTEEMYLLTHVGLYLRKAKMNGDEEATQQEDGKGSDRLTEDDIQSAAQSLARTLACYLRECLTMLNDINLVYNTRQEDVQFTYDAIKRYISTLSNMTRFVEVSRALTEHIPLELIHWCHLPVTVSFCLCEMLVKFGFDLELMLSLIRNDEYNVRNDRLVTALIEVLLEHKPNESKWARKEVKALLSSETVLLSTYFHPLLLCHITDDEFSKEIVKTIMKGVEGKLSSIQCSLLEKASVTTLPLMCSRLTDLLDTVNIVTSRNAALILDHKLTALVQLGAAGLKDSAVLTVLSASDFQYLYARFNTDRRRKFPKLFKTLSQLKQYYEGTAVDEWTTSILPSIDTMTLKDLSIDEVWFLQQVSYHCTELSYTKPRNIAKMLLEVKSESKLINLLSSGMLNVRLLRDIISVAFESMFHAFRTDCVQYNPHLNYLKVHPMLKVALIVLMRRLNESKQKPQDTAVTTHCIESVICFLEYLKKLEHLCLFYIEGKFVDRFIKEHLLKSNFFETLLTFGHVCARLLEQESLANVTRIELYLKCIGTILQQRYLWYELNQNDRYGDDVEYYIKVIYKLIERSLLDDQLLGRRQVPLVLQSFMAGRSDAMEVYLKVMVVAEFVSNSDSMPKHLNMGSNMFALVESIAIPLLKLDRFYPYALTPYELFECYDSLEALENGHPKLPTVPIEHLYDVELLEMFLKRVNVFGFSSRQQFEELFMSLMVLLNRTEDPIFVSLLEQREIKNMCLQALMSLLLSCYRYPWIGFKEGKFHHTTRNPNIKCDTIGLKKLHNVQLSIPLSNVFYQPNLERHLLIAAMDDQYSLDDSIVGTLRFDQNQLSLEYFWEIIERTNDQSGCNAPPVESLVVRNKRYFVEKINIDTTSSLQLIYDVLKQLIEEDPALVLPHLLSFCEIIENRDQIFCLNQLLLKLQERVPMEDTVSQQHIIYLLCRMAALLIPTMSDLTHLCTIIPTYLKSTQLYIRNATLQGLICLLECLIKTNTSIGAMNDELHLLRNVIVNYIVKHGIIEESSGAFSDLHTKLVWTLNFYLIEHTSRFVPDCNLLSNSIISANNILKRTANLEIYLCILNGLERLIITDRVSRTLHEKIEKLAIDLVKIDNEMFSLSALKLLVTCIYRSSNEQLESTERCNGIVQDEPDIIVQQIDKIEILFAKIRTTTPQGAKVFGDVLCQLIRDLLPPNEILTKVFKELMLNQPNPDMIACVTYQLFRSAIDASYLALLQEWLLCSLPNFLSFPQVNKSVWCLTVIFLSASLNQHLIKLLPEVLSLPSYQQLNAREINNFIISAKDFYSRLEQNGSQKTKFKEIFRQHDSYIFQSLVQCL
uniref:Huntingtin n=1 Tax=Anopheles culicifacies TaxID=139723 RepID=A0A182M0T8_9DIPT